MVLSTATYTITQTNQPNSSGSPRKNDPITVCSWQDRKKKGEEEKTAKTILVSRPWWVIPPSRSSFHSCIRTTVPDRQFFTEQWNNGQMTCGFVHSQLRGNLGFVEWGRFVEAGFISAPIGMGRAYVCHLWCGTRLEMPSDCNWLLFNENCNYRVPL